MSSGPFHLFVRNVYGNPLFYPASPLAKQFAQLLGVRTFTPAQITQIANLGFPHELVADPKSRDLVRS